MLNILIAFKIFNRGKNEFKKITGKKHSKI